MEAIAQGIMQFLKTERKDTKYDNLKNYTLVRNYDSRYFNII
jgi:hypothetical protein